MKSWLTATFFASCGKVVMGGGKIELSKSNHKALQQIQKIKAPHTIIQRVRAQSQRSLLLVSDWSNSWPRLWRPRRSVEALYGRALK